MGGWRAVPLKDRCTGQGKPSRGPGEERTPSAGEPGVCSARPAAAAAKTGRRQGFTSATSQPRLGARGFPRRRQERGALRVPSARPRRAAVPSKSLTRAAGPSHGRQLPDRPRAPVTPARSPLGERASRSARRQPFPAGPGGEGKGEAPRRGAALPGGRTGGRSRRRAQRSGQRCRRPGPRRDPLQPAPLPARGRRGPHPPGSARLGTATAPLPAHARPSPL